jgi:hypothetical protein
MANELVQLEVNAFEGLSAGAFTVKPNWLSGASRALPKYYIPGSGGLVVLDVRQLLPDDAAGNRHMTEDTYAKRYLAFHHDAVAFTGADADYDGSTIDEDLDRLRANYLWHLDKNGMRTGKPDAPWSWGGSGYHFAGPPTSGVVYLLGSLDTSRAHVSAAGTPMLGTDHASITPNHIGLGYVFLGNFSDRRDDATTEVTSSAKDRPTEQALQLYQELIEWLPGRLERDLDAMPHKGAHPNHTSCPGDWIHRTARDTFSPQPVLEALPTRGEYIIDELETIEASVKELRTLIEEDE